jgi:hypothetical protein
VTTINDITAGKLAGLLGLSPTDQAGREACRIFRERVFEADTEALLEIFDDDPEAAVTGWGVTGVKVALAHLPGNFQFQLMVHPNFIELAYTVGESSCAALVPQASIRNGANPAALPNVRVVPSDGNLEAQLEKLCWLAAATASPEAQMLSDELGVSIAVAGCFLAPVFRWYKQGLSGLMHDEEDHAVGLRVPGGDEYELHCAGGFAHISRICGMGQGWSEFLPSHADLAAASQFASRIEPKVRLLLST